MPPAAVFFCLAIAGPLVLGGWGWLVVRALGMRGLPLPLVLAAGLSGVIFLGGIANFLHLARPPCFDVLAAAGAAAAIFVLARRRAWRDRAWRPSHLVVAAAVVGAGAFVLRYLTPQAGFNWADDFERYFSYPVRMLETGTIGGNPLSIAGMDSLGGQAFLQAFVLRYFPTDYIASVEWVVALFLCLVLTASPLAGGKGAAASCAALLAFAAIDPEIVNVSSIYTSAALMMGACLLGRSILSPGAGARPFLLLGLFYAGLFVLKSTNSVFIAVHFGLLMLVDRAGSRPHAPIWQWCCPPLCALLAAASWFATHWALYREAFGAPIIPTPVPTTREVYGAIFSTSVPLYGVPQLCFGLAALAELAVAGWLLQALWRRRVAATPAALAGLAAAGAGGLIYIILVPVMAPTFFGQTTAFRYCAPILMATAPMGLLFLAEVEGRARPVRAWIGSLAAAGALVAVFLPPSASRLRLMEKEGCALGYLRNATPAVLNGTRVYTHLVLHSDWGAVERRIQGLVPPGQPVIVWTMTSFLFDFVRNPILNTDPPGLSVSRRHFPRARYILVQYQGPGVRNRDAVDQLLRFPYATVSILGVAIERFAARLAEYAQHADVLYKDDQYLLLRLRPGWTPPP